MALQSWVIWLTALVGDPSPGAAEHLCKICGAAAPAGPREEARHHGLFPRLQPRARAKPAMQEPKQHHGKKGSSAAALARLAATHLGESSGTGAPAAMWEEVQPHTIHLAHRPVTHHFSSLQGQMSLISLL